MMRSYFLKSVTGMIALAVLALVFAWFAWTMFRIDVPAYECAILTRKTGLDISNTDELAPLPADGQYYKGVQQQVLLPGRYFYNPYNWDWEVIPQVEVESGQLGVLIRKAGDDLPYGEIIAWNENQKGIVPDVSRPGRYAINPYEYDIEMHQAVIVPAGYRGVRTLLAAPMPENPNVLLVEPGTRGVQRVPLGAGTYYVNPYVERINLVDCRSQRFNLGSKEDMGFPSKDGFWIVLDGVIEFRIDPDRAPEVFVTYNDMEGNTSMSDPLSDEIINKVIMPNARAFCRLRGSAIIARDFISGETRTEFQHAFEEAMREACEPEGVHIVVALITEIRPPVAIASPIREREVSRQQELQYRQQILQQQSEKALAIQEALVQRRQDLVAADQQVIEAVTLAEQEQRVAVTDAEKRQAMAELQLEAARDQAAAIVARGQAQASVIEFNNRAQAAGWNRVMEAFSGDGAAYAQYVLYQKLAPGFQRIMANTADSPLMQIFQDMANEASTQSEGN